jgi:hypothetical protein
MLPQPVAGSSPGGPPSFFAPDAVGSFSPAEPPLSYTIGTLTQAYPGELGIAGGGLGFDLVHAEFAGQLPEGLLLGTTHDNSMDHLGAPGHSVPSSLYVQRAVRHQPVTSDHDMFVQRAVRASQLESALRQAVVDAGRWASQRAVSAMGPWPLGQLPVGAGDSVDVPAGPSQPDGEAVTGVSDAPPASPTEEGARSPDPASGRPEGRAPTTAAPGFRSQLENSARGQGQRPLTRATVRQGQPD